MSLLAPLDLKVLRDFRAMRGQLLAIALVIACGLGVFLMMRSTMYSLERARSSYYAEQRFGDVFARLVRAPEHVARRLAALPGVQAVETRVVADVTLDVPGMTEAVTGRLVSLPESGRPRINDVVLRKGRLPSVGRGEEVVVGEAFAEGQGLEPGDRFAALIDGNYQELRLVGVVLSPEYTYATAPGSLFPDDRRFGVIWMNRRALAAAFDLEGSFNDVSLRLARGGRVDETLFRVDRILDRYGGVGAIARDDQESAFFVANELRQLDTFAWFVPAVFLAVAAFLLNVVLGRIVAGQREEIAALKAFGYRDREVGLHYAKLVGVVVAVGVLGGVALGSWMGAQIVRLYADFYRFPDLVFRLGLRELLQGTAVTCVAAALGTWRAIRDTVELPPAEALRPEAPPIYRATLIERLGLERLVRPAARIVLRELERQPRRALMSVAGIALATGLTVVNAFTFDSVNYLLNVQFGLNQREDVQVVLYEPRSLGALASLEELPGVVHAEPYRSVPVRMRVGPRQETTAITGITPETTLSALLDSDLVTVPLPPDGVVLSRKLAELLAVDVGGAVHVEVKEGRRAERRLRVARIVETFVGTGAHMALGALCRLLGEPPTMNGAWLAVDERELEQLYAEVKRTPLVAGVTTRDSLLAHVRGMMDQNLGTFVTISLAFSLVMAFGVLYNAARITLAERARELASLRVLGFHRREVAAMLLGELGLLVALAIPLGLVVGRILAGMLVQTSGYDTEQFRLPLIIAPSTYAMATLTVVVAAVVSGWNAWRKLDRFDIVEVLKSRD